MSSSNLVRVAYIEETTYGETPVAGNFGTARFTSEALSASPVTVESQQLRTDRMSSGQIVAGLDVKGSLNFELAKETMIDEFLESAMYSTWDTLALVTVDLTIDTTAKTITRASGDFSAALVVGDILTLAGFVNTENNVQVMITEITSATVIKYAGPLGMVDEAGSGTTYKRADKLEIGSTKKSFSIEKKFTDLTNKGINYTGMIANSMDLNLAFGSLVTGSFGFVGNGQSVADLASELITNGRTVDAAATTDSLNGSVDMPFFASDASGTFESSALCAKSISLKLDNNLIAQNCIGSVAPDDYSAGTCKIGVDMSVYNDNLSWDFLNNRLTQAPIQLGFMVKNSGGWYGFYLPAVQTSFDDPSAGGQNQDIMLEMKGQAKVGSSGESAIVIYRS